MSAPKQLNALPSIRYMWEDDLPKGTLAGESSQD